jgi:hypothetical protein
MKFEMIVINLNSTLKFDITALCPGLQLAIVVGRNIGLVETIFGSGLSMVFGSGRGKIFRRQSDLDYLTDNSKVAERQGYS